jgi:hypothetical protein
LIITGLSFGDGIESGWPARAASPEPASGEAQPPAGPVPRDGFNGIVRTGRGEAAGGDPTRASQLIGAHQPDKHPGRDAQPAGLPASDARNASDISHAADLGDASHLAYSSHLGDPSRLADRRHSDINKLTHAFSMLFSAFISVVRKSS